MRARRTLWLLAPALAAGCAVAPQRGTIAELAAVPADLAEVEVADSLDLATASYRRYLEETPTSAMTPEAMRRLADGRPIRGAEADVVPGADPVRRATRKPKSMVPPRLKRKLR